MTSASLRPQRRSTSPSTPHAIFASLFVAAALSGFNILAADLHPSFPNHALVVAPTPVTAAADRRVAPDAADVDTPFTWDQTAVVFEGQTTDRVFRGFDPLFQPVTVNVLAATPTHLRVTGFDGNLGVQSVKVLANQGGTSETFQFQIASRGLTSGIGNYIYDIRALNTKVRSQPATTRSAGSFIQPGQIVKFTWTPTTQEKFANCEALLTGRTGMAKTLNISSSVITRVLATKVQPVVLGHYLMLVTPREVRGQPPLGSDGNGVVFRCVFGTNNLPPVTDGFLADTFTPLANQVVTLQPNATDPETGQTTFTNETFDFGDGSTTTGVNGATTHAYARPGLYRVQSTVADDQGLTATAADTLVVGSTSVPTIVCKYTKEIPPSEAGDGLNNADSISATFKDPSGLSAKPGDRIVFAFNRNHFEYVAKNPSDSTDTLPIVLGPGRSFTGTTVAGAHVSVAASGASIMLTINAAQFDRTGDPRLGRCDLKGIFKNQRIALSVIPADGSTPRVMLYTGNLQGIVKNGQSGHLIFIPETHIVGISTTMQPNPRLQEP